MKKNKVAVFFGILLSGMLLAACTGEQKQEEKLVLGTSADYPPYEFHVVSDGVDEIVGFDIDIAKEIAKDMGKELEIKDMDFGGLIAALKTDSVDFVIAGMNADEERAKEVDFSEIYYSASQGILVDKIGNNSVIKIEDLANLKVGIQMGSVQEKIAQEIVPADQIVALNKIGDLVMKLKSKKIDAILVELPVATAYASKNDELLVVDPEYISDTKGFAVAVKKDSSELVNQINTTLKRLKEEGKLDEYLLENMEKSNIKE